MLTGQEVMNVKNSPNCTTAISTTGNVSQSNHPRRSTQPGHPSMGRCNEYLPKGGDALRLGVKADMVLFAGNTV